ncbi:MAG: Lpg1974 family pore-forming outer membrane protein [Pirellulaceae bacterium]
MVGKRMHLPGYLRLLAVLLAVGAAPAAAAERASNTLLTDEAEVAEEVVTEHFAMPKMDLQGNDWQGTNACPGGEMGPWFAGVDYRLIRAHFSEAVAYVQVNDSLTPQGFQRRVQAEELNFDYNSSVRFYLGAHLGEFQDIRFAYWNFNTEVAVNGTAGIGQTLVDPFGNLALTGSSMSTRASVNLNVFDLEYLQTLNYPCQGADFVYSAGLRFANVDQAYDSVVRNGGGSTTSIGDFAAYFSGVGPNLMLTGRTSSFQRRLSLFAKGGAALLIGSYDVSSDVTIPGFAIGGQTASRTRTVPIMEAELGGSWHSSDRMIISAGWLYQAWFNIGTSGGTFDGENLPFAPVDTVFGQTDDADIMSFEGLFIRAEFSF